MSYELYDQSARSVQRALDVLALLRQRQAITAATVEEIRRRRRTADIALQGSFDELRRAFITPTDREDILLLRQTTERIANAAEDIPLSVYRQGRQALLPDDTALLAAVTAECQALYEAVAALPAYPRDETVLKHLVSAERLHRISEENSSSSLAYDTLMHLSAVCRRTTDILRYTLLKMT